MIRRSKCVRVVLPQGNREKGITCAVLLRQCKRAYAQERLHQLCLASTPVAVAADTAPAVAPAAPVVAAPKRKLSYKEQRELDELPGRIEALEAEQAELNKQLADPDIYRKEAGNVATMHARVEAIDEELLTALARWEELGER